MNIKQKYYEIVKTATIAAGAIGVPGAVSFGLDITAMTGIWSTMIVSIAKKSGHEMNTTFATKLAAGVLAGVASYIAGSKIAIGLLNLVPGAGTLTAMGVNCVLNAFFTYKMGATLATLFDKSDFNFNDTGAAAASLLSIVSVMPSWSDLRDLVALLG